MRETACELIKKKKKKASAVCNDYVKQKRKGQLWSGVQVMVMEKLGED